MKTTVVPAQVTTVEDKIAGNLNFTQLLLLTTPVFVAGVVFALLPPFLSISGIKIALCGTFFVLCAILAIRIRGTIIMQWLMVVMRYNLRARYFIYNKNDTYLRDIPAELPKVEAKDEMKPKQLPSSSFAPVSTLELVRAEAVVADERSSFHFTTKKGGLRVSIKEIK